MASAELTDNPERFRELKKKRLLANQNRHLVHHLYPTVPFYRYRQIREARKAFHESHGPATVQAWRLHPEESEADGLSRSPT